ncbi:MAG: tRNA guanosine(34) transglycosylase Tgt [Dehalococcoidia bacterium]|nr:tRNA guanosine(34) transglycosylase Tgt [Dehalococcoidia bacterium]MDD5493078.1 tRNA guanosine(34) transglycosylase Tgt [Dehalococcoidia bacterium]
MRIAEPFKVTDTCSTTKARLGQLKTLHGKITTPIFFPVGSQATVKSLSPQELKEIGIEAILCNTYHLYLRPGIEVIEKAGGLHNFMGWDKPILTDSGGYQIFSLSSLRQIDSNGVRFRSHIDGSEHYITPEYAVQLQEKMGADIIMALDVCPSSTGKKSDLTSAVEITTEWADRCIRAHTDSGQHLFGIIQGGVNQDLRKMSAEAIVSLNFPGYAIGGLSLGEKKSEMWGTVEHTVPFLPSDKPRYLMGVGSPEDIIEGISKGIDIFDSALPTRVARNGALYTHTGRINIKKSKYKDDMQSIEESCTCFTCRNFSLAYVHHLFKSEELLAYRLATIHNVFFINSLIFEIRESIKAGQFADFRQEFFTNYQITDEDRRIEQKFRSVEAKGKKVDQDFQ